MGLCTYRTGALPIQPSLQPPRTVVSMDSKSVVPQMCVLASLSPRPWHHLQGTAFGLKTQAKLRAARFEAGRAG